VRPPATIAQSFCRNVYGSEYIHRKIKNDMKNKNLHKLALLLIIIETLLAPVVIVLEESIKFERVFWKTPLCTSDDCSLEINFLILIFVLKLIFFYAPFVFFLRLALEKNVIKNVIHFTLFNVAVNTSIASALYLIELAGMGAIRLVVYTALISPFILAVFPWTHSLLSMIWTGAPLTNGEV